MTTRSRSALWLIVSPFVGAFGLAALGVTLFGVSLLAEGGPASDLVWIGPWVAIIAAIWGAIGASLVGSICAAVVAVLDRRRPNRPGAVDAAIAATLTAIPATLFGLSQLTDAGPSTWTDLFVWLFIPLPTVTAIAAVIGWQIWRRGSASA